MVGELDGAIDGLVGDSLAELLVRVPDFRGRETGFQDFDYRAGDATTDSGAEKVIQVQGLEGVMGADTVAGGLGGQLGSELGLILGVAAGFVGGDDKVVMGLAGERSGIRTWGSCFFITVENGDPSKTLDGFRQEQGRVIYHAFIAEFSSRRSQTTTNTTIMREGLPSDNLVRDLIQFLAKK